MTTILNGAAMAGLYNLSSWLYGLAVGDDDDKELGVTTTDKIVDFALESVERTMGQWLVVGDIASRAERAVRYTYSKDEGSYYKIQQAIAGFDNPHERIIAGSLQGAVLLAQAIRDREEVFDSEPYAGQNKGLHYMIRALFALADGPGMISGLPTGALS